MQAPRDLIGKTLQGVTLTVKLLSNPDSTLYLGEKRTAKDEKELVILADLHSYVLRDPLEQASFIEDASRLQRLEHPFILPVVFFGFDEDIPYFATKFVARRTLQTRLRRQGPETSSLSEALHILTRIGQALHYAHQRGIVHGALSAHTVLFGEDGEALLSGFPFPTLVRKQQGLLPSPAKEQPCLAPEQRSGTTLPASDQYALGCLASLLCMGHWPLSSSSRGGQPETQASALLHVGPSTVSEHLSQVIAKALRERPEERYGNMAEFLEALLETQEKTKQAFIPAPATLTPSSQEHTLQQSQPGWLMQKSMAVDVSAPSSPITLPSSMLVPGQPQASSLNRNTPILNSLNMLALENILTRDAPAISLIDLEKARPQVFSDRLNTPQPAATRLIHPRQKYRKRVSKRLLIGGLGAILLLVAASFLLLPRLHSQARPALASTAHPTTQFVGSTNQHPSPGTPVPTIASRTSATNTPATSSERSTPAAHSTPSVQTPSAQTRPPTQPTSSTAQATPTMAPTSSAQAVVYSFEGGSLDGWQCSSCVANSSTTVAESGSHSLAVTRLNGGSGNLYPYISGSFTLHAGQTITAYVYVPTGTIQISADISLLDSSGHWYDSASSSIPQGAWTRISYTVPSIPSTATKVGLDLYYATGGGANNPVYIDNISW